ncbi:MAG: 2-iminoacetate synthase ThiH [Candidatus Omnitrophota bacterium]
MSFYDIYLKYKDLDLQNSSCNTSATDIEKILQIDEIGIEQFLLLLSCDTENCLENLAQRAHQLTLKYFGRTIQLYTPLYLSNYCDNECLYCGFNAKNNIIRKKLSLKEVEKEAQIISSSGLKHILVLTGESRSKSPLSYIKDCLALLKKYFSSIAIEIYALREEEYKELIDVGVDGLTIYQEVYDHIIYDQVHFKGPKKDYRFRLEATERAAKSGMHFINIGSLLGLANWRKEVFLLGLHAKYLQENFRELDLSVSIPRIRPHTGDFKLNYPVTDKNIVQAILALRIFFPRLGITLSTRENYNFRDNLVPLGITRMSAGSKTCVGGHIMDEAINQNSNQFEINDRRNVYEIIEILEKKGYQAVLKDWMHI